MFIEESTNVYADMVSLKKIQLAIRINVFPPVDMALRMASSKLLNSNKTSIVWGTLF